MAHFIKPVYLMFYGTTPQEIRSMYFSSWKKHQENLPLSALEQQIVAVILDHPEYYAYMTQGDDTQAFYPELGETNPFLHMGLHLAIREQVATNRPLGITAIYHKLLSRYKEPLKVEHLMSEQLAECMWLAQKNQEQPDDQAYLTALNALNSI